MIPKTIHYCWFGGNPLPKQAQKCIESWKKYCPEYDIVEWNENNFDLAKCPEYVRDAYSAKKFAFASDYVRLKVLYEHGGFYMDTDVELLKSLNKFENDRAVIGFENDDFVNSGQMLAAEAGHPVLAEMMEHYCSVSFYKPNGEMYLLGCPHVNTEVLVGHGLVKDGCEQTVADVHVYPADWFNPLDSATGELTLTENTVSIHRYAMSWVHKWTQRRVILLRWVRRILTKLGGRK